MKQIVELQNPSDAITFEMDDVKVAGVAVMFLGNGAYGLEDSSGKTVVPIMLFGTHEKWLKQQGIVLDDFIPPNMTKMADFLETVCYGHASEREAVEVACARMTPEKAEEHRKWWNDKKRTSLCDIGKAALKLAKQFRKAAAGQAVEEPLAQAVPIIAVS